MRKKLIRTLLLIIFAMFMITVFSNETTVVASQSKVDFVYSEDVIKGLESIRYQSLIGDDFSIDFRQLVSKEGYPAFYVLNPSYDASNNKIQKGTEPLYAIAGAIIGEAYTHSVAEVAQEQGISLSQNEYNAAIQMAISEAVGEYSTDLKLDLSTIKNNGILSVSGWLQSLANTKYNAKDYNIAFSQSIATPTLFVNDALVSQTSDANFVYFGPYTAKVLNSILPEDQVSIFPGSGTYAMVDAVGGTVLKSVKQNGTFYLRVGKIASDITASVMATVSTMVLNSYGDILYLQPLEKVLSTPIIIGKGDQIGKLAVNCLDKDGLPIEGVRLTVMSGNESVETLVTSATGQAVTDFIPLGNYTVVLNYVPAGFVLDTTPMQAAVSNLAGISPLQVVMRSDTGYIDIRVRDSISGKTVPGATFSLYSSEEEFLGELGTDEQGDVIGYALQSGNYVLYESSVPNGYDMMINPYSFSVTNGETTILQIKRDIGTSLVTFTVRGDSDTPVPFAQFSVYRSTGDIIGTFTANNLGTYSCFIPDGKYLARSLARESTGEGELIKFTVEPTETVSVDLRGTYSQATLSGILLSESRLPIPGIGLVALSEDGSIEYSFGYSDAHGEYQLTQIPVGAVVNIRVYNGIDGYSSELKGNRVIMVVSNVFKDFILSAGEKSLGLYQPLGLAPVVPKFEVESPKPVSIDVVPKDVTLESNATTSEVLEVQSEIPASKLVTLEQTTSEENPFSTPVQQEGLSGTVILVLIIVATISVAGLIIAIFIIKRRKHLSE